VAGGAVTTGVCVAVGPAVAVGPELTVGPAVAVGLAVAVGAAVELAVAVEVARALELAGAELLPLEAGKGEPDTDGRKVVTDGEGAGGDDVQPATAAKPRTAVMQQPAEVSSARGAVPEIGVRTILRYPVGGRCHQTTNAEYGRKGRPPLRDVKWRHIAGFRVVVTWPRDGYAPPPVPSADPRARIAGIAGALLLAAGIGVVGFAVSAQLHAPQPSTGAAGSTGPPDGAGRPLSRSVPVRVDIPAIGVTSELLHLGVNADGTIAVPPLDTSAGLAAWYKYSATPGQIGTSVIEGHVDDRRGPAVFFRLGALRPGDTVDVTLADGVTAVFRVTGVRKFSKARFPAQTVYGPASYPALRLITCGGAFDSGTGHYLDTTVVFASLSAAH